MLFTRSAITHVQL